MILCLGTTPAAQRVMVFRELVPNAVNRAATTVDGYAGKSINVAKILKALGEQPVAVTVLGGPRGEELSAALRARGLELEVVRVETPTRQCITVIDQSCGRITELVEESRPVPPEVAGQLMEVVRRRIGNARAIVMSGSLAPGIPAGFYRECISLAEAAGALSIVDAQGPPLLEALSARPGLAKPNRSELAATAGRPLPDLESIRSAIRDLIQRGARRVVVTAGAGEVIAGDETACWRIQPPQIQAVCPIGSGDAFTAALAQALLRGDDLGEACRRGAAAGAANALQLMSGEIDPADFRRLAASVTLQQG